MSKKAMKQRSAESKSSAQSQNLSSCKNAAKAQDENQRNTSR